MSTTATTATNKRLPMELAVSSRLLMPKDQALKVLQTALERGLELARQRIKYPRELDKARQEKADWVATTNDLLLQMFDTTDAADEFNDWVGKLLPDDADTAAYADHLVDEMQQRLRKLKTVLDQVAEMVQTANATGVMSAKQQQAAVASGQPVVVQPPPSKPSIPAAGSAKASPATVAHASIPKTAPVNGIFILHGQEETAKLVCQFVRKLGLNLVVLNEQAGGQKALVEQLEQQADAAFVMLMINPETAAAAKNPNDPASVNARHSMTFELGYCVGRMGLRKVIALYPGGYDVFTDEWGVMYIPIDPAEGWQLHLARQLKKAGLEVDLNRLA